MANKTEEGIGAQPIAETTIMVPELGEIRLLGFTALSKAEVQPKLFELSAEAPEAA